MNGNAPCALLFHTLEFCFAGAKGVFMSLLVDAVRDCGCPFSESTVLRWMHEQGFRYGRDCKGVFKDGHEREDVVQIGQMLNGFTILLVHNLQILYPNQCLSKS